MNLQCSRRHLLKASIAGLGMSSMASKILAATNDPNTLKTFSHGVASGEPQTDSVLLWTRVSGTQSTATVSWEISSDMEFNNILQTGTTNTSSQQDYCVKAIVTQLLAGQVYYYRFQYNGVYSEPGRTRTLPTGHVDKLCMAVASCSNYPFGYFNAYEVIAADPDIDFVLHLGDYIYEYGHEGYGGKTGKAIHRNHSPAHEIVSLDDYRQRHAQYKADPASRLLHAMHPIIPTWDDHESANNPYMYGAQNHQSDKEGEWAKRREASVQAYYEWMPIREPKAGNTREQLWRHFQFGDLASLVTLETRHTGRAKQIDYKDHLASLKTPKDRDNFLSDVLGADNREMLSGNMKSFYQESMTSASSQASPWHLLGNQIPMARTHVPNINELLGNKKSEGYDPVADEHAQFRRLSELDLPIYLDTWDGYPKAREMFYQQNRDMGIEDLLVLTGDSHSFWANRLLDAQQKPMGLELGTAGITSPGDFEGYGPEKAQLMDTLLAQHNEEIEWTDNQHRGFVKLELSPEQATADFIAVDNILSEKYKVKRLKRVVIEKQGKHIDYRKT